MKRINGPLILIVEADLERQALCPEVTGLAGERGVESGGGTGAVEIAWCRHMVHCGDEDSI